MLIRDIQENLQNSFPTHENIPPEFRIDQKNYPPVYLLDGEILTWTGPLDDVSSPVCTREKGMLKRTLLGQVPSMDEVAAMKGLHAAVRELGMCDSHLATSATDRLWNRFSASFSDFDGLRRRNWPRVGRHIHV